MNPLAISFLCGFIMAVIIVGGYASVRLDAIAQSNYDREQTEYDRGYKRGLHDSDRKRG